MNTPEKRGDTPPPCERRHAPVHTRLQVPHHAPQVHDHVQPLPPKAPEARVCWVNHQDSDLTQVCKALRKQLPSKPTTFSCTNTYGRTARPISTMSRSTSEATPFLHSSPRVRGDPETCTKEDGIGHPAHQCRVHFPPASRSPAFKNFFRAASKSNTPRVWASAMSWAATGALAKNSSKMHEAPGTTCRNSAARVRLLAASDKKSTKQPLPLPQKPPTPAPLCRCH